MINQEQRFLRLLGDRGGFTSVNRFDRVFETFQRRTRRSKRGAWNNSLSRKGRAAP